VSGRQEIPDDDTSIRMIVAACAAQAAFSTIFGGVPIVLAGGIFLAEIFPVN
jgi:hypothetical protein